MEDLSIESEMKFNNKNAINNNLEFISTMIQIYIATLNKDNIKAKSLIRILASSSIELLESYTNLLVGCYIIHYETNK